MTNITQNDYTFHVDLEWKITDKDYTIENHRLVKTVNISAKDFFNNDSFVVENHMGNSFEVKLKEVCPPTNCCVFRRQVLQWGTYQKWLMIYM